MPRYTLRCNHCDNTHEVCVPISARHEQSCPLCGGDCKPIITAVTLSPDRDQGQ